MKALAAYFRCDVDLLLDDAKEIPAEHEKTKQFTFTEPPEQTEEPETFCDKSCSRCEYREALNCPGCREGEGRRYGGCRLAQCCRDHFYPSCKSCGHLSNCDKYRNIPGQQERNKKDRLAAREKMQKVGPVLGKWLGVLFWLTLLQIPVDLLNEDFVGNWMPWLQTTGEIAAHLCSVASGLILIRCGSVTERYRTAGCCRIMVCLLNVLRNSLPDGNVLTVVLLLVALPGKLVAVYEEYMGHAYALENIADDLSSTWSDLWKWYIGLSIGVFVSAFFGKLMLLLVLLANLALAVYELVLRHRTKELFKNY